MYTVYDKSKKFTHGLENLTMVFCILTSTFEYSIKEACDIIVALDNNSIDMYDDARVNIRRVR